ncbi:adenosylhomocysteinase [Hydrogenibacillus schlegelii]|uniref:Adenosylhomocysteinase n=1 Tax=Hydrogenibacillus schlegelii TaxID=1484 RepID=A0A132NBT7_HYDSH|nr:adenosylhomocysteinase [Hydrogenibacillus schlegelii]KWX07417.1 S-adenosyl-L-homocysteine hydrolase [Hydrogenibacillus schlegelii]OAR03887.1 adenosylhomocysteinase [Hydrogenibacillus schlegelii]
MDGRFNRAADADAGRKKIEWARRHMPVLGAIAERFEREKPLAGERVSIALHLEAKTAVLALVLQAGGADVTISGSNPLSTQDDVAHALARAGVRVFARRGVSEDEYRALLLDNLEASRPTLLIDDGGDLVKLLHAERSDLAGGVKGGAEETTTGMTRLRALAREGRLAFPMVAVNDARMKHLFDNRYGTGQSVIDGILRTTNLTLAGKTFVVVGYGWCGKGVALRARGMGANVVVTEIDPVKAIEAHMEGYRVMPMAEAAAVGDLFVTVTGGYHAIGAAHFLRMKDGAILANAGHFDVEIDLEALRRMSVEVDAVRPNVTAYRQPDGRTLYVLAEGRLVNLAGADGHPAEIMDMTFALQALSLEWLAREHRAGRPLPPALHPVPEAIDRTVAEMKLRTLGIAIDRPTPEQEAYAARWA